MCKFTQPGDKLPLIICVCFQLQKKTTEGADVEHQRCRIRNPVSRSSYKTSIRRKRQKIQREILYGCVMIPIYKTPAISADKCQFIETFFIQLQNLPFQLEQIQNSFKSALRVMKYFTIQKYFLLLINKPSTILVQCEDFCAVVMQLCGTARCLF